MASTDDLALLFKLGADGSGIKTGTDEGAAAVRSLSSIFTGEIGRMQERLIALGSQVPLLGSALLRIVPQIKQQAAAAATVEQTEADRAATAQARAAAAVEVRTAAETGKVVALERQTAVEGDAVVAATAYTTAQEEAAVATEATGAAVLSTAAVVAGGTLIVLGFIGALYKLAKAAADNDAQFIGLSKRTGLSVELLSGIDLQARKSGTSVQALANAVFLLQRNATAAENGNKRLADAFKKLGVDTKDALHEPDLALKELARGLAKITEEGDRNALGLQVLSRQYRTLSGFFIGTKGDIDGVIRSAERLGLVVSEQDSAAAKKFKNDLEQLSTQFHHIAVTIGREVIPAVDDWIVTLAKGLEGDETPLKAFGDLLYGTAKLIGYVVFAIYGFGAALTNLVNIANDVVQYLFAPLTHGAESLIGVFTGAEGNFKSLSEQFEFYARDIGERMGLITSKAKETRAELNKLPFAPGNKAEGEEAGDQAPPTEDQRVKKEQAVYDQIAAGQKANADLQISILENQLKLGQATREQELNGVLEQNRLKLEADVEAAKARRRVKEKELDDLSGTGEKVKEKEIALNAELAKIDQDIQDKRDAFAKDSQARIVAHLQEERQAVAEHRKAVLELQSATDKLAQDQLKDRLDHNLINATEYEQARAKIELDALSRQRANLQIELAEAGAEPSVRQKIQDQITALDQQRTTLEFEQAQRRKQIAKDEADTKNRIYLADAESRARVTEIQLNAQIAAIENSGRLQLITQEKTARAVTALQLRLIDERIELLKLKLNNLPQTVTDPLRLKEQQDALNNQIKEAQEQRTATEQEGNRRVAAGRAEDVQNYAQYLANLRRVQGQILAGQLEYQRRLLSSLIAHHADRRDIIEEQRKVDLEDEQQKHDQIVEQIRDEEDRVVAEATTYRQRFELHRKYNLLIEQEDERHALAEGGINRGADEEQERINPISVRAIFGDDFKDALDETGSYFDAFVQRAAAGFEEISARMGNFGSMSKQALNGIAGALQQGIASWILYGGSLGQILRKATASVLAELAAQAAVKAIFELAEGFAALFFHPAAAAAHFHAAALYGAVAVAAGVGSRAIAGNSFQQASSGATTSTGAGAAGTTAQGATQQQERTLNVQPPAPAPVIIHVQAHTAEGTVLNIWHEDIKNAGRTHDVLLSYATAGGPP